jgi:hypothetical protein
MVSKQSAEGFIQTNRDLRVALKGLLKEKSSTYLASNAHLNQQRLQIEEDATRTMEVNEELFYEFKRRFLFS